MWLYKPGFDLKIEWLHEEKLWQLFPDGETLLPLSRNVHPSSGKYEKTCDSSYERIKVKHFKFLWKNQCQTLQIPMKESKPNKVLIKGSKQSITKHR